MIELKNINKSYGDLHVLKDISLTISKKESRLAVFSGIIGALSDIYPFNSKN